MSDLETRIKRGKKYKKRDPVAQFMNEHKGAFAMKVVNPKKGEYKRERIDVRNITLPSEEE